MPNRSRMRAIPRSAAARPHANGLRMASRVPRVWVRPHGRGSRRTSCSTAVAAVAGAWRSGGTRGRAPASVPDGEARTARCVPAIQPASDGFRMARTQHACARRDSRRHAGRAAQERCRSCTHRGRRGMIAQVVAGLPLRDGHVKGSACRQRTFLSKACHGWISGERNIFSKSISPRLWNAKPACTGYTGLCIQRPSALRSPGRSPPARNANSSSNPLDHRLLAIGYRLSAIGYRLSAIGYRLSVIGYRTPSSRNRANTVGS